jgi:osmotically-inducible protein OsmY
VAERSADDIQRDIERSRAALAEAVDEIAYRTNPKRVRDNVKQTLREKAQSPQGKIVIGVAGGVVVLLIIKRVRKARH